MNEPLYSDGFVIAHRINRSDNDVGRNGCSKTRKELIEANAKYALQLTKDGGTLPEPAEMAWIRFQKTFI